VDAADVSTRAFSSQPVYVYPVDGPATVSGFEVSQDVAVLVRDVDAAGSVLDAVAAAGGNAVRVSSFVLDVLDPSAGVAAARVEAVAAATLAAEQYAELLGVELGAVVSVSESSVSGPVPVAADAVAAESGKGSAVTPVSAGVVPVSVSVSVSWLLED
jgi:uncharacterized protein YggE